MTRHFNVVLERDSEGFFVATVPALPGCHTQAQSLDQLMERVQEAIALYLEVEGDSASEKDFVSVQWVVVEAETVSPQRPSAPLAHAAAERLRKSS